MSAILSACFAVTVHAQYQVESWTTDKGLPQNTVLSILQTQDGYLWMTTLDGLVRYDGVHFTVFNKNNTKGIITNRFTQLVADTYGNLWIGTEGNAVTRYYKGTFQTYTITEETQRRPVRHLLLNSRGNIVIFSETGIIEWNGDKFVPHTPVAGETKNSIVLWGKTGAFWYINGATLSCFKDGRISDYKLPYYSESPVNNLFEDSRGRLWIGTNDSGVFVFENGKITSYTIKDGLPSNHTFPKAEDRNGNIWIVTNQGAAIISDGKINTVSTAQGLSDNALGTIYEDREGNIWIGTYYRGLNRVNRQSVQFYSKSEGLAADIVNPIYEDREGAIWIGGKNLTRYHAEKFNVVTGRESVDSQEVTSIHQDSKGRLWFGHWLGIYFYEDGKFTDFTNRLGITTTFTDIHEDRTGTIWFASSRGVFRYQNDSITHFTVNDGLVSNDVKVILESSDGSIWFGTYGGITQLKNGSLASFTTNNGLASNQVRSLYEDSSGALWIGSYDNGLTRLKDGKFTRYTTNEGLFNDGVFQILEDERGWFWMSCNRGIYRVAKQQLNDFADGKIKRINSIAYGKGDGLLETECNGGQQPAGIKTRDGRLWFPTQRGVAVINPNSIPVNTQAPPVRIETFLLNGEIQSLTENRIVVQPGVENLEIAYTGLSFIKPEQVRFKYKMIGLDSDWVDVDSRRTAYYSHLPPGEYTFVVIAANSDGVWNETGASISVRVIPPFYKTSWFILLVTLSVIGLIALFYHRRVAQLRKEKAQQEAFSRNLIESQERERGRIAAELHDGLSQSLVIIKNRATLSLQTPDDSERAFEQLEEISAAASEAMFEAKEIIYNLRPIQLDRFGLTKAIQAMLKKVSDTNSVEFTTEIEPIDGLLTKEAESSLYRILQESVNNIVRHSEATKAEVVIKRDGEFIATTVRDNGKGFIVGATSQNENHNGGFGLVGIIERARLLKGEADIKSTLQSGTVITITLPLKKDLSESQTK